MNRRYVGILDEKLSSILLNLGMPEECELLGRKFKFSYYCTTNKDEQTLANAVRISGTILGTHMVGYRKELILITTPLPKSWNNDFDSYISLQVDSEKTSSWQWRIFYPGENAGFFPNKDGSINDSFPGELYLL